MGKKDYTVFMKLLNVKNPFGAPVYHEEIVSSTFDVSRALASRGESHGTVITADFQEAGRGRLNRPWTAKSGENLLFNILLRYSDFSLIPVCLTLKTGLAVALAVENIIPSLKGLVKVKWPNDVMVSSRKTAGILTESDGKNVFIGVGVNVFQTEFPPELNSKVGSLKQAFPDIEENLRFLLLEKIISHLYEEIEKPSPLSWRERIIERLYKKGEFVTFAEGSAISPCLFTGKLSGIGDGGELLIIPPGAEKEMAFVTGELLVYQTPV